VRVHSQCLTAMVLRPLVVTVALNSINPCVGSRRKVVECCFYLNQEGEGLAWPQQDSRLRPADEDSTP